MNAELDAFKPEFVDTLVEPYLAIQQGLAGDDLSAAKAGAKNYLDAMKAAPHKGEAPRETVDLSTPAKTIAEASDITASRSAFLKLSKAVTSLVQDVGTTVDTPLSLVKCPMAFNNKGGIWVQSGKTVANPYYGSMMLRCGSVQKQISGKSGDEHGSKDHGSAKSGDGNKGGQSGHSSHAH